MIFLTCFIIGCYSTFVRLRILVVVLVFYLLIAGPYLLMALTPDPGYVFGGLLLNPLDGNSYLAKMHQGWRGEWTFTLPYTADPGEGSYLFLFYIFLGHLARWLNLPLIWVFHLARLAAAGLMLWALWRFLAGFCPAGRWPVLIFAGASLGLGMGWLALPFGAVTADFVVPEAYPFLSACVNPHFPLGLALLLWLLALPGGDDPAGSAERTAPRRFSVLFVSFLLSIISPFGVVVALMVLGGMAAWELFDRWAGRSAQARLSEWAWHVGLVFAGGAPFLIYDFWIARSNPALAIWNAQNLTASPPIWDVVLALSPALILALPGAWWAARRQVRAARPLLVWAVLGLVLIYIPFDLQRRFMMGIFVPFIGLAGLGLHSLAERGSKWARLAPVLLLLLSLPTTLLVMLAGFANAQGRDPWLYLYRDEANVLAWMDANLSPHDLVLASPETGMFIPAYTAARVIYGHPFETANAEAEKIAVTQFFLAGQAGARAATDFVVQRKVVYIFYGPREQALGALPDGIALKRVYASGNVTLYQVSPSQ